MLFITNRSLNEGLTPDSGTLPRTISFNLYNNEAGQSVYFCRRTGPNAYQEIGSRTFFNELKGSTAQHLLFYLHGYNSMPEEAIFPRMQELQRLCDRKARENAALNDNVLVIGLIWPCDNDFGQVKDYYDDQIAADRSDIAFARLFQKFLDWRNESTSAEEPCTKRLNLLSHSMGARVVRGALNASVRYFLPQGMPLIFRNIFLTASDIGNDSLEPGQDGQQIPPAARNVVVYYAADDLAMRASKAANVGTITSRRMGHTGPANLAKVPKNVYAIDCDNFNSEYEPPVGHGYFASDREGNPGRLFNHLWQSVVTGRVPMTPAGARVMIL